MITNKCENRDISCEDGVCPDCNYYEYQLWIQAHAHCDQGSWDCPDPEDCPHKKIPNIGYLYSEMAEVLRQKYL